MIRTLKDNKFNEELARAFGGSIIFCIPLIMTMEMWYLGFYISLFRMIILLLFLIPLLTALSYKIGFKEDYNLKEAVLDAFTGFAIGFITALLLLVLFRIVNFENSFNEELGKITLQSVPASIGAVIAKGIFGGDRHNTESRDGNIIYFNELVLMAAGALFFSFNLSPTEEMILLAFKMNEMNLIALMLISLTIMHSFVYYIEFHGKEKIPGDSNPFAVFLKYTLTGYSVVLIMSFYILWTFGRTDALSTGQLLKVIIVLAFPGSIGAAAARLII